MKITKNIITRDEALAISPDYVAFVEGDFGKYDSIIKPFNKLKKGQKVVSFWTEKYTKDFKKVGHYVSAVVSSVITDDFRADDGPVIRVSNGEYTWRVDGSDYAFPIKKCN